LHAGIQTAWEAEVLLTTAVLGSSSLAWSL